MVSRRPACGVGGGPLRGAMIGVWGRLGAWGGAGVGRGAERPSHKDQSPYPAGSISLSAVGGPLSLCGRPAPRGDRRRLGEAGVGRGAERPSHKAPAPVGGCSRRGAPLPQGTRSPTGSPLPQGPRSPTRSQLSHKAPALPQGRSCPTRPRLRRWIAPGWRGSAPGTVAQRNPGSLWVWLSLVASRLRSGVFVMSVAVMALG